MTELRCQDCLWHGPEHEAKQEEVEITTGYKLSGEAVKMKSFETRCPVCNGVNLMPEVVKQREGNTGYALGIVPGGAGGTGLNGLISPKEDVDFERLLRDAAGEPIDDLTVNYTPGSTFEAICVYYGLPPFESGSLCGDAYLGRWIQNAAKQKGITVQELEDSLGFTDYKKDWFAARLDLLVEYEKLTGNYLGCKPKVRELQEMKLVAKGIIAGLARRVQWLNLRRGR